MTVQIPFLNRWLATPNPQQRRLVPEVVQTSHMDCGPAALKAVLQGFGISVSYGRLREACQTGVDGTSIDTIEEVAQQLGVQAQQILLPTDFLFVRESGVLPAIVVTRLPNGATHFEIVWSLHGSYVQVMDPGSGRRWVRQQSFLQELYTHTHLFPADVWRAWAGDTGFIQPLSHQLDALGLTGEQVNALIATALEDETWFSLGTLDAATRLTHSLMRAEAILKGVEAANFVQQLLTAVAASPTDAYSHIPSAFWSATLEPDHPEFLSVRGAVMITIEGVTLIDPEDVPDDDNALSKELTAALNEADQRPFFEIWKLLREDGMLAPSIVAFATLLASLGVMAEALILRGILYDWEKYVSVGQRTNALLLVLAFGALMILIEFALSSSLLRMGRHVEMRLRVAFLTKIPRLSDRYFQSRLISDMTARAHELAGIKSFPALAARFLRLLMRLVFTTIGVVYFVPEMVVMAFLLMVIALLPSFAARPLLQELDMRYRTHSGGLGRFYLDGLLGLIPIRTHSAETAFQNAHEMLLTEWYQAGRRMHNASLWIGGVQSLLSIGSVVFMLMRYVQQSGSPENIFLIFYWVMNIPTIGSSIAGIVMQYPQTRNRALRILEPLGAPDESTLPADYTPPLIAQSAQLTFHDVGIVASGHTILQPITFEIGAGEHVAIVGPSGAGKSSFVGLLLGWHKPAGGTLLLNGNPLDGEALEALRRQTVWVDPAVHLWNRTLHDNLSYGNDNDTSLNKALQEANLYDVLERLPNGMQTMLGEGGGLVSGGQGQRVRLGRGLLRKDVRLVILDEPFRGLDRPQRQSLLKRVRDHWQHATLLFISHDVGDTRDFERVLVIESGQIVEDAPPSQLLDDERSLYHQLLAAEDVVRRQLWESTEWRRLWLEDGKLSERHSPS